MLYRLSQKLAAKIKAGKLSEAPPDENPYADWSAHLFIVERIQYIILCNTRSLYSCLMPAKGITTDRLFFDAATHAIRDFLERDGQGSVFQRFIVPESRAAKFAKALNRSVIGSMNDLIVGAKWDLSDGLDLHTANIRINETPLSALSYAHPREVFKSL